MPKLDDDYHVALEHIDRVMQRARDALAAEDGVPSTPIATASPPPAPPTPPPPMGSIDAPEPIYAALIDQRHDGLTFAPTGAFTSIADHPHLPELARAAHELNVEYGQWLKELPVRAQAITQLPNADDRALKFVAFEDELALVENEAQRHLQAAADRMRTAATELKAKLMAPGADDLPPEDALRLSAHVQRMGVEDRKAFIGRLERHGDHVALRAIAADPLNRYLMPDLDPDGMIETAGRLRTPRNAALERAYLTFAERLESNVRRMREEVTKAHYAAATGIPADKVALVRSARRTTRH